MIIQAKRANRAYKYRDIEFFINDHMSSENKRLFELARSKKKELNFKFLWTKNGYVHLRENEQTPTHKITCENNLRNLLST